MFFQLKLLNDLFIEFELGYFNDHYCVQWAKNNLLLQENENSWKKSGWFANFNNFFENHDQLGVNQCHNSLVTSFMFSFSSCNRSVNTQNQYKLAMLFTVFTVIYLCKWYISLHVWLACESTLTGKTIVENSTKIAHFYVFVLIQRSGSGKNLDKKLFSLISFYCAIRLFLLLT